MRAVIQRVSRASVQADGKSMGDISRGLLILVGVAPSDTVIDAQILAKKIHSMRIFSDENGKMNLNISDASGSFAVISNFTLYANCVKGNRPDFFAAAAPDYAKEIYLYFVECIKNTGLPYICGIFGADMKIDCECDGPVTVILDSSELKKGNSDENRTKR